MNLHTGNSITFFYQPENSFSGNQLLPTVAQLLIHLPSPQKLASDQNVTNYSLALLTQHTRHLWLQSLILILYKYRFDQLPVSEYIVRLIGIVVKTLQSEYILTPVDFYLKYFRPSPRVLRCRRSIRRNRHVGRD